MSIVTNTDAEIDLHVKKDLVDLLYKNFHLYLIAESIAAICCVMQLWNAANHIELMIWLSLSVVLSGFFRHILTFLYHYYDKHGKIDRVNYWQNLFNAGALLAAIIWGLCGYFFITITNELFRFIILIVLIAVAGAYNAVYLGVKSLYIVGVLPIFLFLFIILIMQNTFIFTVIAVAVVMMIWLTMKLSFGTTNSLSHSLWLQYKNKKLAENLFEENKKLDDANRKLQTEIKARLLTEKTLQKLATHDPLTGLSNRKLIHDRFTQSISRADRHHHCAALLMLDLDHFKAINDTFGHDVGDKLLVEVSNRLLHNIRKIDAIARLGGDEFCILTDDIEDIASVEELAKKLCTCFREPFDIVGHKIHITISVGISIYPDNGKDLFALFKSADIALYQTKNAGRNSYKFFESSQED